MNRNSKRSVGFFFYFLSLGFLDSVESKEERKEGRNVFLIRFSFVIIGIFILIDINILY